MSARDGDTDLDGAGRDAAEKRLRIGQTLAGRYEIEAVVGEGGMGVVYRAFDRKLDESVALKVLSRTSEAAVERFSREVRLGRRVTHPNIVRTHDLGEHDGLHFLTMELVAGTSLEAVLAERGALPAEEVVPIGVAIAAGLEAAHEAGVVHRDLKPANVLIADDGRVRITDFGIARAAAHDTRTSATGTFLGTPHYMAPEQVSGQPVDARSDIYSLGCMLYELLTGKPPYDGPTPLAVASQRLIHDAPADPRTHAPVPDSLAELVLRCLRRERGERPRSAKEVGEALEGRAAPATGGVSRVSLFAPMLDRDQPSVAVLPFTYRGDGEHAYLGEGFAEELIDVLARTRGLTVFALGATRRFAEARDPTSVTAALGATAVVDGTVQLAGDRVRLSARLVDGASGVQLWNERFDGPFSNVFALQESMGRRVAEALRLEVDTARYRQSAPEEAIALYLRGRRGLMADVMHRPERAEADLARSLELAPHLTPAVAALAMASVRAWWGHAPDPGGDRAARAERSVHRAREEAPDLGETQVARAMLAVQRGDFREAASAIGRALELVPTLAFAHQYLGAIQIEAGREREGRDRLRLALDLDPSLNAAHFSLARLAALDGDEALHRHHVDALAERSPSPTLPLIGLQLRVALWRGDREAARRWWRATAELGTPVATRTAALFGVALGETAPAAGEAIARALTEPHANARFTTLIRQIATEVLLAAGAPDRALAALERSAEGALVDVVWLRRCPLLGELHADPRFQRILRDVDRRARDVWRR